MRLSSRALLPAPAPSRVAHGRVSTRGARWLTCSAVAASPPATSLTLHVDQTSISFPLPLGEGRRLQADLRELLQTFAAKQKAERPQKWRSMEFRVMSEEQELRHLEIFCNPNAAATAFDARALITLKTAQGISVTTEGRVSDLKADLDAYMEQHG